MGVEPLGDGEVAPLPTATSPGSWSLCSQAGASPTPIFPLLPGLPILMNHLCSGSPDTSSVLQTRVPVWRGCDRGVGLRGKRRLPQPLPPKQEVHLDNHGEKTPLVPNALYQSPKTNPDSPGIPSPPPGITSGKVSFSLWSQGHQAPQKHALKYSDLPPLVQSDYGKLNPGT